VGSNPNVEEFAISQFHLMRIDHLKALMGVLAKIKEIAAPPCNPKIVGSNPDGGISVFTVSTCSGRVLSKVCRAGCFLACSRSSVE